MDIWKNGEEKRVCDISEDRKIIVIEHRGFVTRITANADGTLQIQNVPESK